jgi:hypothetical protein
LLGSIAAENRNFSSDRCGGEGVSLHMPKGMLSDHGEAMLNSCMANEGSVISPNGQ